MNASCDDLSQFAVAIVRGHEMPPDRLADPPNYSVAAALDIYRNNYRGNLHDALAGVYPVIEQLVGKDFFRLLTRNYIERHLSCSGNLHRYGAEMAAFITTFTPAQQLVYLPDVAALEWACHCAYFAADAAALDLDKLSQIDPEHYPDLRLHIQAACHVVRSRYPVAAIWHAHQPGEAGDFHIDLDSGACRALVSRKNDAVQVSEMNEAAALWLSSIRAGNTLGVATDAALEKYPDFDLQAVLLYLLSRDVFADFNLGEIA